MNTHADLLARLRSIVGATNVLTEGDLSAWEMDWRKRERGKALAVVRPASTDEVAQVVKACAAAKVSMGPRSFISHSSASDTATSKPRRRKPLTRVS